MLFKKNEIDIDILNEILKCFNLSTSISVAAYDNNFKCLANYTNIIKEAIEIISIDKHFNTIVSELHKKTTSPEEFIFITDQLQLTHAIIGLWNNDILYGFIIAGPINFGDITIKNFEKILHISNIPIHLKQKLIHFFEGIPEKNSSSLRAVCKLLLGMITSPINYFKILAIDTIHLEPVEIPLEEYIYPSESYQKEYKSFLTELIRYTKLGDKEKIQRLLNKKTDHDSIFSNELTHVFKNQKTTVTWMLNLFAFPLIETGINTEKTIDLIAYYLNAIANCQNATEITILSDKMINDFLDEAAINKGTDLPSHINKAIYYINHNLHEDITLEKIAKVVHMSPNYFSRYFKQNIGTTFKEYVNEQRIKKAKDLLNYTDESLDKIALALGFKNQAYFTTVFKKHTGTTPKKYRYKT